MKSIHLTGISLLVFIASARAQAPNALPGLRLWLDAQDNATVVQAAGRVVQWNDKSGNGFHATQDDTLRQPSLAGAAINGHAGVHFDGAAIFGSTDPNDDGLFLTGDPAHAAIPTLTVGRAYSIFMVSQYWGAIQGRTLQGLGSNWLMGNWNTYNGHYANGWVGGDPTNGPNVAGTNNPVSSYGSGSLSDTSFFVNGRSIGRGAFTGSPGTLALGTPLQLSGPNGYPEPSQADIGEVLVYNRLLGDNEARTINSYLANRWGLARPNGQHDATQTIRFTGADAGEGLDFQGNFIAAVNMAGPAVSIGNASFAPSTAPGANVTVGFQNTIGPGGWGAPNMGPSTDDQALNNVLNSINWTTDGNVNAVNATVNGLIPGHAYKVQLLTWEACCGNRHYGVEVNGDPVKYDFHEAEIQGQNAAGTATADNAGTAVVHSFIAGSNSMNFRLTGADTGGGDRNAILNGFTVEDLGVRGPVTTGVITTAADIKTAGTFLFALDFGNVGGPKTVNGLTFQPAEGSANTYVWAENTIAEYNAATSTGNAELDSVLKSIRWEGFQGEDDSVAVDLVGLTPGAIYELTLLFSDANAANRTFDINVEGEQILDDFKVGNVTGGDATKGAKVEYVFTAGDPELNILLNGGAVPNAAGLDRNPILSGATLRLVPEPGSVALTALAASALILRRRRK
ncbi:MAG TPA: PEP-CTERM sorting domain-containing protein [Verrucomicrobiales bacterium]|nr:PEP-CTERM sorting domain-containing protein [Verrucomicrobiales bacterium]